jgi:hypothetical protein
MSELLQKLSTYNIFNYLFPGVVFVILLNRYTEINLVVDDVILGMFLYYFFGLVLSRIGSILIEPALRCTKIVQFSDYARFIRASKLDDKIELLSEVNNMHRTIIAMLVVLLAISICNGSVTCLLTTGLLGIVTLFVLSYRKQTSFITKRIDEALRNIP